MNEIIPEKILGSVNEETITIGEEEYYPGTLLLDKQTLKNGGERFVLRHKLVGWNCDGLVYPSVSFSGLVWERGVPQVVSYGVPLASLPPPPFGGLPQLDALFDVLGLDVEMLQRVVLTVERDGALTVNTEFVVSLV